MLTYLSLFHCMVLSPDVCVSDVAPRVQTVEHWRCCNQCNAATTPLSQRIVKTQNTTKVGCALLCVTDVVVKRVGCSLTCCSQNKFELSGKMSVVLHSPISSSSSSDTSRSDGSATGDGRSAQCGELCSLLFRTSRVQSAHSRRPTRKKLCKVAVRVILLWM